MSNHIPPPGSGCDPACQTKIIVNGGNIAGIAQSNFAALNRLDSKDLENLEGAELIKLMNRMEDDAVAVQKLIVKGVGYDGPTGKMLE